MSRPRLLLADDHKIFLAGLQRLLESTCEIVGTAENGRELLESAARLHPDIIVMDISMPLLNGIEAALQLRRVAPTSRIVFLTMHADVGFVREAFRAGASAYVVKQSAPTELLTAIRDVMNGRSYVTPALRHALPIDTAHGQSDVVKPLRDLTPRQREVIQLVAEGRSLKEIANILNVSAKTVEFHKYRIMEELGLRTTAELTKYAVKHGIVAL